MCVYRNNKTGSCFVVVVEALNGKTDGCQSYVRDGIFWYNAELFESFSSLCLSKAGCVETDTDLPNPQAQANTHKGLIDGYDLHPAWANSCAHSLSALWLLTHAGSAVLLMAKLLPGYCAWVFISQMPMELDTTLIPSSSHSKTLVLP